MLQKSNTRLANRPLAALMDEAGRFERFSRSLDGLLLDQSRVRLDEQAFDELLRLAAEAGVAERRDALFSGEPVNASERRPALHMALRSPDVLDAVGGPEAERVSGVMQTMRRWAQDLHSGRLPGYAGARVEHLVHVGIGGSLLGTQLVCEALDRGDSALRVHFLGSVDAGLRERLLGELDPGRTAVVLVSKSFGTVDTLMHGRRLADWLAEHLAPDEAAARVLAVTSRTDRARAFGVDPERVLYFPEWVGGRYSLWSPVSLSAAAVIGPARFQALLDGGAAMDRHFREAEPADNLPVRSALVGVWHRNFQGHAAWGVMPYDRRLRLLPAHLQQLVMESNGKSVTFDGRPVTMATSPVVFGETGTEAQHSVFQALHQGTDVVPLTFIGVIRPRHGDRAAQSELLANLLAQATALARGRDEEATRAELGPGEEWLLAHRTFAGNRPSEVMMLDELDPRSLGLLLAFFEHRVFVESVVWGINAFDQWGVELGKSLAPGIREALESAPADGDATKSLLDYIRARR